MKTVSLENSEAKYYRLTPEMDTKVVFASNGNNTYGYLYDDDFKLLDSDNSIGDNDSIRIVFDVVAGKKYYLGLMSCDYEGDVEVSLAISDTFAESVDIRNATVNGIKDKTYTGETLKQKLTVKNGTTLLQNGKDYSISYKNNKNAGRATATIIGMGEYKGSIVKTFKINKAPNTLKVNGKTVTAKSTKNVAFASPKVFAISNAQGKITFLKVSGDKKISVNKKTGKITVSKGLKKGKIYTAKILVKANGTKNYMSKSKTVAVKIKVK